MESAHYLEFTEADEKSQIAEIKKTLHREKLSGARLLLNIPRQLVFARLLQLPSVNDQEIERMLRTESLKQVPYAEHEISYGFRVIQKAPDGYSKVLLAIVQKGQVNRLLRSLAAAGLAIEKVCLGSEGFLLWMRGYAPEVLKDTVLVLHWEKLALDINIFAAGELYFSRGIALDTVSGADTSHERIASEIRLSIANYEREAQDTVKKIVVIESPEAEPAINFLRTVEDLPTVEITKFDKRILPATAHVPSGEESSLIELLGLAERPDAIRIDLSPDDSKLRSNLNLMRSTLWIAILEILLLAAMVCALIGLSFYHQARRLDYLESEIAKISAKSGEIKQVLDNVMRLHSDDQESLTALDALREIHVSMKPGVTLGQMDYEMNKSITLKGQARSLTDVVALTEELEASASFENVKLRYAAKKKLNNDDVVDFEVVVGFSQGKKAVR